MRRTLCITLAAFLAAMAVCALSYMKIGEFETHARHLRTRALLAMDEGEVQQAEVTMTELASYMQDNRNWLEMLCEHNDLHELKGNIIDAQASIEFGIEDDFYQAMYRFGEGLDHIFDIQQPRVSNLY